MTRLLVGVVALGIVACGAKQKVDAPAPAAPPKATMSAELKTLLGLVPPDAAGVLLVDQALSAWGGADGLISPARANAMRSELEAYMRRELGIDPLDARAFVVFGGLGPSGPMLGLLARPVAGELKAEGIEVAKGMVAEATLIDGTLVLGLPGTGGRVAQAAKAGKSIADTWPWFSDWIDEGPRSVAAAVDVSRIRPLLGAKMPPGIDRATMAVGGGRAVVSVYGDHDTLSMMRNKFASGMDEGIAELETARTQMTAPGEPPLPGIASIVGFHMSASARERLPEVDDGSFVLDLPFDASSPMLAVGVLGVLSAVAIPAFMKYIAKSKTTEAKLSLKKIADGARAYATEKGTFPPTAPLTPASGPCGADKCAPGAEQWAHPTWQALLFSMDLPHYYAYEFVSDGTSFTARARGDLDGDGEQSTFEIYGQIENGEPVVSPTVASENELE